VTVIEGRRRSGRQARQVAPRADLGQWSARQRQQPALAVIAAQSRSRLPELAPIRHARMASSPWHFYRGAAAVMAADLATAPHSGLMVQLCGDAHVLNFGLWATPERNLAFDLRDFDETLPGPFEWDVKRLVTSLQVAAGTDTSPRRSAAAVASCLRSYRQHMASFATAPELDIWYDATHVDRMLAVFTEPGARERLSRHITKKARRRTSRGAHDKLTALIDGRQRITEDPPFRVHLDGAEHAQAAQALHTYRQSLSQDHQHLLDRFELVDVVRQVVGVGSVGMRVYLALLQGRGGDDPLFLQVKEATTSVYEPHLEPSTYASHGERVVVGKRLIQSATDIFVGWAAVGQQHYYVRQFRDMKVIPDSQRLTPYLVDFATACGAVLARAHARTGDAVAIHAYIGPGSAFDKAMASYALAYARQNHRDHADLVEAISRRQLAAGRAW